MNKVFADIFFSAVLALVSVASAGEWFVAPDGRDSNPGSVERPFAGLMRAQSCAQPGDTVYFRGGTYRMRNDDIAMKKKIWAFAIHLGKSGLPGKRIVYCAYNDEKPVFDFTDVRPDGLRVHAFEVTGSWLHLKGIEVVGVQVTVKSHTQSICFSNNGSHNIYEGLGMHDGQAIGIYTVRGSDNLFLNCDAYNNHDYTSEDGLGGNTDGFGCHPARGCTNNVFRGCRAWFNSDDGFDCIGAHERVVFEGCWAFYNGYNPEFKSLKDGNGFKAGGYGSTPVGRLPSPIPRHLIRFCIAARNKAYGFYSNHHPGGSDWINNSAYRNRNNFNMLCRREDNRTDVPGFGHTLLNNLAYGSRNKDEIIQFDADKCTFKNNSFDTPAKMGDGDFCSLDIKQLMRSRSTDGSLPAITFLKPVDGSALSEQGVFGE